MSWEAELAKSGPMVLFMGYAIVHLWRENRRLQDEKDKLHARVFNLFVSAAGLEETNHGA
ncbi:MAG: hypothetical protein JSV86_05635 [Gemmatimonadota bacterium]|nr:MAG: hypothetical protein JSV86_05635 [Gemmatimonadota bacterium]